jgi:hypothetical protein
LFWRRSKHGKTISSSYEEEIIVEEDEDGDMLEMHAEKTLQGLTARDQSDPRELNPT